MEELAVVVETLLLLVSVTEALALAVVVAAVAADEMATIGVLGARNEPEPDAEPGVASAGAELEAGEPESRRARLLDGRRFGVDGSSDGMLALEDCSDASTAARRLLPPAARRTGFPSGAKLVFSTGINNHNAAL